VVIHPSVNSFRRSWDQLYLRCTFSPYNRGTKDGPEHGKGIQGGISQTEISPHSVTRRAIARLVPQRNMVSNVFDIGGCAPAHTHRTWTRTQTPQTRTITTQRTVLGVHRFGSTREAGAPRRLTTAFIIGEDLGPIRRTNLQPYSPPGHTVVE